jgi:hypothetical protein
VLPPTGLGQRARGVRVYCGVNIGACIPALHIGEPTVSRISEPGGDSRQRVDIDLAEPALQQFGLDRVGQFQGRVGDLDPGN